MSGFIKTNKLIDIKNYTRDQLSTWLKEKKIQPYRADQIFKWIYIHQADTFSAMTNISKETRSLLSDFFHINRNKVIKTNSSTDGTKKYLFKLHDGESIESVLIPEKSHYTICISTQVGCAQNCSFCMTAKAGFIRNLTTGEIISQICDIKHDLKSQKLLTNIVFMGMGEPLANYKNVKNALNIITDSDYGLKFSNRRVTLSTCGIIPKIPLIGKEFNINLAISLNATNNKIRNKLMPVNKKYPLEALLCACENYPLSKRRKITFEYILIKGINDSLYHAAELTKMLNKQRAKINLIPFNKHPESDYLPPDNKTVEKFQDILHQEGFTAIIRHSKGKDISAACGQLRAEY